MRIRGSVRHRSGIRGIDLAGRTDPLIIADAIALHGIDGVRARGPEFRARYFEHLAREMQSTAPAARALPGVDALLDHFHGRDDAVIALLTGNFQPSARLKLEPLGLWHYFRCGAFGDDARRPERARAGCGDARTGVRP